MKLIFSPLRYSSLWLAAGVVALGCSSARSMAQESNLTPIAAERYVAVDDVCAWPMLTTLPDGTIIAIIHNQPSHGQQEGQIEAWASKSGAKWGRRGFAAPKEPGTVRMNVGVGLDRKGDLIVVCSGWSDRKHPDRPKQPAFRDSTEPAWVCRSSDGGFTWIQQKHFAPALAGWLDYIPFGPILVGENGSLHMSAYSGEMVDPSRGVRTKGYRAWHFQSDDNGVTWRATGQSGKAHSETALLHLGGRSWLAVARERGSDLFRSDDDGVTWSGPQAVGGVRQIPGHLTRLKDGRLLLSYGSRVPNSLGGFARLSDDQGRTWGAPIYVAKMSDWDGGYPSSAQRADGKIVTAYYAKSVEGHMRYHMGVAIWEAPAP